MTAEVLPVLSITPGDIATVPLSDLIPFPGNPRRGDIMAIRKSLRRFGQQKPVIVQRSTAYIVAGNHLFAAMVAEDLEATERFAAGANPDDDEDWPEGLRSWPDALVAYTDLDDTEAKAFALADNRMSELGHNDPEALTAWLNDLNRANAITDAIGYQSEDLDRLLSNIGAAEPAAEDVPDLPLKKDVWVKAGDLFALGEHRLLCADATQASNYDRLLGPDGMVQLIWTDPPYGVQIVGRTKEALTIANDESDAVALDALLRASLGLSVARLARGRGIYVSGPGGQMARIFLAVLEDLGVYRQTIVWVKDVFVMGRSDYHYRHENLFAGAAGKTAKPPKEGTPIHYGWRPGAAHWFVTDRTLDTVWEIPRPRRSTEHPTMKPLELVGRAIQASSSRGDLVLDPFAGSGTTLIAADQLNRKAAVMELDPRYAQVTIERWQGITGGKAEKLDG